MRQMINDPFVIIVPVALLLGTILAGLLVRRVLFAAVRRWAKNTDSQLDVLVIDTLKRPIALWAAILGLHLATQNSEIPARYLHYIPKTLQVLWGLSFTIAISHFAGNMVKYYGSAVRGVKAVTSLSQKLVQFSILIVGITWLLKVVFDISLTPLLTTLGVGGLAVALALQDTLSNLFAGFYVSVSGLVRIDDYIRLNTGEEGYITDINWRCTTMRTRFNNLVVIPNNKLGQAIFTNYFLPDGRMVASILCGVAGESDIGRVEKLMTEEAIAGASEIASVLADPAPTVLFNPGPWTGALIFQIVFSVGQFVDLPLARSEMRKRIVTRLRREGIEASFPTGTAPTPMNLPAAELTQALSGVKPGRALDLACGSGRHAVWLRELGWEVTAVDLVAADIGGVTCVAADLEHGIAIQPGAWDLIVCWLYWQENLLPALRDGVRNGGYVALAGKTSGRFATSLERYRQAFTGWQEITAAQDGFKVSYIAVKPQLTHGLTLAERTHPPD